LFAPVLCLMTGSNWLPGIRRNMKNRLMPLFDKLMVRKLAIIETIHDQLKNISQIGHTRYRSLANFLFNAPGRVLFGMEKGCGSSFLEAGEYGVLRPLEQKTAIRRLSSCKHFILTLSHFISLYSHSLLE